MDYQAHHRTRESRTRPYCWRRSRATDAKKNALRPHLKDYWCIPQKPDADFVACMEDIIEVYERPYVPRYPVVCLDEKPIQLLGEVRAPLPMRPGAVEKIDAEYKRNGTCSIFAAVEPLTGRQHISVRERRTALDWAEEIQYLCDVMYPQAEQIILVMDNLNTHTPGSLYKRFRPDEANRLARRLEIHHTPKHGSWLNMAEIELNVLSRQCLNRRIESRTKLQREGRAWENKRNRNQCRIRISVP
jgi:hypothetical protein